MIITKRTIEKVQDIVDYVNEFKQDEVLYAAFDTETTGLNIVKDVPFLFIFGYFTKDFSEIKTWIVDIRDVTKEVWDSTMYAVKETFAKAKYVFGHNIKYDLHMLANIGYPVMFKNVSDTQIIIRLSHPSLVRAEGGPPDDLTGYVNRYIDKNASSYQKKVKYELKKLKDANRNNMLNLLKEKHPVPKEYGNRRWTKSLIDEMTKDPIEGTEHIPDEILKIIEDSSKEPSWINVPKQVIHEYAHMDVVYTLMIFHKQYPILKEIGHEEVFKRENDLIIPLYKAERAGLPFNREYAKEVEPALRDFILVKRERLKELAGQDLTVNQHGIIKEVITDKFKHPISSTGKDQLDQINSENKDLMEFIDTISELRTLEKWYSTYLKGYIDNETDGRIHTTFKQSGAVTGRLSSGFQQFPRGGITDGEKVIFHPRRLVKVDPNSEYDRLGYIDYSQIELRVQAAYTILISGGDLNLCRAFMPFKCISEDGIKYELKMPFADKKWFLEERPDEEWHPVDLHTKTAEVAFGDIIYEDLNHYRSMGKTTNFACNYGSGVSGIMTGLKSSTELASKMFNAYSTAYPGIYDYRDYVRRALVLNKTVRNLYNRHYYGASAHKVGNYLVQGSAADIIKIKMIEIENYIEKKGYKTRVLMNIHDEIQFEIHKDEPSSILYEFKAIMEDIDFPVPIVADIDISYTSWDEAKGMEEDV